MFRKKSVLLDGFGAVRDLGGVVFLDVRDQYGVTQAVISGNEDLVEFASHIPIESTITLSGTVRKRDKETYNPTIDTGEVEVFIQDIKVLGK